MSESNPIERRLTLRLLAHWEKAKNGRCFPAESDIDPDVLGDLWNYCFLIHVKDLDKTDYNYTYMGSELQKAYQGDFAGSERADISNINARKLFGDYAKVVNSAVPLHEEGEFVNQHNDVVKYRQCLLPLGDSGTVDAIFGGMSFKVFAR